MFLIKNWEFSRSGFCTVEKLVIIISAIGMGLSAHYNEPFFLGMFIGSTFTAILYNFCAIRRIY